MTRSSTHAALLLVTVVVICSGAHNSDAVQERGTLGSPINAHVRAFVLAREKGGAVVAELDLGRGGMRRSPVLTVEADMANLLVSPDGSRLIIVDIPKNVATQDFRIRPLAPSRVIVLDSNSWRVVAEAKPLWGFPVCRFAPDGRSLLVVNSGYHSGEASDTLRAEVLHIDIYSGEVTRRVDLEPLVAPWANKQRLPAFVAGAAGTSLYILDPGAPRSDRGKHLDGQLLVVNMEDGTLRAALSVGSMPRLFLAEAANDPSFVLSDAPPYTSVRERRGELRVIRNTQVSATVAVAPSPQYIRLSPNKAYAYVVSHTAVTSVDLTTFQKRHEFQRAGPELVISSDGSRGYFADGTSRLTVFDLDTGTSPGVVKIGRTSARVGNFLGELGGAAAMGAVAGAAAAAAGLPLTSVPFVYLPPSADQVSATIAAPAEDRYVYVLNSDTRDITVVDPNTMSALDHLPVSGFLFQSLGKSSLLCVRDTKFLRFVDTKIRAKIQELEFRGDLRDVQLSPDQSQLCAASADQVTCLDAETAKTVATFSELRDPVKVTLWFGPASRQ